MEASAFPKEFQGERRKSIGIGVIIALVGVTLAFLGQFGGVVWFGAILSSDVRSLTAITTALVANSYTRTESLKDLQRLDQTDLEIKNRLSRVETRLDELGRK